MSTYTTRETARILNVPVSRVQGFVRAGVVNPKRGPGNAYLFNFQDLLVMRTALRLEASDISRRRVNAILRSLRGRMPDDRSLSSLRILAQGRELIIDDALSRWNPDSGQTVLDFEAGGASEPVQLVGGVPNAADRDADDWFELGCSLEASSPRMARELYCRALEMEPDHVDARINLGRLQHEDGQLEEARRQYERALEAAPRDPTAAYNLGVVLEDLGKDGEAILAYQRAIASDEQMADAYYNLARLYDQAGDRASALRHLRSYSDLVRGH